MLKSYRCYHDMKKIFLSTTSFKRYSSPAFKPFYENFFQHRNKICVVDKMGHYKYGDILYSSFLLAERINKLLPQSYDSSETISFLCPNDATYVTVLLACWITGNIAVPLSSSHPKTLQEHMISNSKSKLIIASESDEQLKDSASNLGIDFLPVSSVIVDSVDKIGELRQSKLFAWDSALRSRNALIIYTSGTTGIPKGVPLTHGNLFAQVSSLSKAWEITSQDTILHSLPLHHMHGIMNALLCLLHSGGSVIMLPRFKASMVWNYLIDPSFQNPKVNLFFGVPAMYVKLIEEHIHIMDRCIVRENCQKNIRLMTCGSAALPESVLHKWEEITGHVLLERYGMSEVGMALSNPLKGARIPGTVGTPLPGVKVKIVNESSSGESLETYIEGSDSEIKVFPGCEDKEGELLIKGPNVFRGYWNNLHATNQAFTDCGWFRTGDIAKCESGYFKMLGRISTDMIKHKGYKISALSIESCLFKHRKVLDCAVLGIPDEKWGEKIACLVVTTNNDRIDEELLELCKKYLPVYSKPSVIKYVEFIPRNVTGKMNKKELKSMF